LRGPGFSDHYKGESAAVVSTLSGFPRAEALERSVRMMLIVVPPKRIDLVLCVLERREPVHVQTLLSEPAIEGFDRGVVRRLAASAEVEGTDDRDAVRGAA
jgi:hypothetical protein